MEFDIAVPIYYYFVKYRMHSQLHCVQCNFAMISNVDLTNINQPIKMELFAMNETHTLN